MMRVVLLAGVVLVAGVAYFASRDSQASLDVQATAVLSRIDGAVRVPGLKDEVQVLRDTWGVPHIFAKSADDVFLAQGYVMAQDRLWQMDVWRRTVEGRLAEVLGAAALPRDRQARLLRVPRSCR